jgi:hypothetical protein
MQSNTDVVNSSSKLDVVISKEMAAQFTNQEYDLKYFVGLRSDSSFNS